MLYTTTFNRARRDTSNRAAAWKLITTQEPDLAASFETVADQEQAIDDVIRDWCADFANELERGFSPS